MGLKWKWFKKRLTFDGIPSHNERSVREKEVNFFDFYEMD